ncbi:NUDIX domain-containing protein [Kitasatospora sp. NPDC048298]|uniref:NUDIX domain-containing protein n=1 Tax=Kitasatospora sp. NPDC048298 TaxID=3364049 RepID=UPI00371A4FE2
MTSATVHRRRWGRSVTTDYGTEPCTDPPPGGVLELDEAIEDGVRREVYEETGIKVGVERLTGVYKNVNRGIVALVLRCRPESDQARLSEESVEAAWLTPAEVSARMAEVYAVRVLDALQDDAAPSVRTHDGRHLL